MIVAYIGNFVPEHSTENHVRQAWENQGHTVVRVQEGEIDQWERLIAEMSRCDLVLWTRTASEAAKVGLRTQWRMLAAAERAGKPTVGFHLDRWWGLNREQSVWTEPFFRCSVVITADGGHQAEFESVGINHVWLSPAVSLSETEPGEAVPQYRNRLAFVGSWQPGYHPEWSHRRELVEWLNRTYPRDIKFWPRPGQPAIRGADLRNLYASVDIIIGDSCLAGGASHYWSDRIPETVGRGGFLIHPDVEGLSDQYTIGEHLWTWPIGNWGKLKEQIGTALNPRNADMLAGVREAGRDHVRALHTYDVRVNQIREIIGR